MEVMLNMHSSSLCARYFVYHHENGTSPNYAVLQQNFINGVRSFYPNAIEPYNYFVSWTSGTALQYPESWCWLNHGENIMAITYEDKYKPSCSTSGNYDSTANAILRGVLDYMNIATEIEQIGNLAPTEFRLEQNYPNPFNPSTKISWESPVSGWQTLKVYNILGNEVATLVDEYKPAGTHNVEFRIENLELSSGIYFYKLQTGDFVGSKKMILLK
ncbi:MAG: T9SS type A sorting domain-containing protein [Ignavibacterium sp.]|nr:T9SS type A sorting domain-containing protein [Ignavibacterium sp.]